MKNLVSPCNVLKRPLAILEDTRGKEEKHSVITSDDQLDNLEGDRVYT